MAFSRAKTFARPKKTPVLRARKNGCTVLATKRITKVGLVKASKHNANPVTDEFRVDDQLHGLSLIKKW